MRIAAVATAVVLGLGTLSGCSTSEYCKVVAAEADSFKGVDLSGAIDLEESQKIVDRMAAAAPSQLADDWRVIVGFFASLVTALTDAGFDDADLDKIAKDGGASLSKEEAASLTGAFLLAGQSVDKVTLNTAMTAVEEYTQDECDVSLTS